MDLCSVAIVLKVSSDVIRVGIVIFLSFPWSPRPNCPASLAPQTYNLPWLFIARECL
jgi:hypothetical protein